MRRIKDALVEIIGQKAWRRTGELASELVRVKPADKEDVLAELEFQQWLAQTARESVDRP